MEVFFWGAGGVLLSFFWGGELGYDLVGVDGRSYPFFFGESHEFHLKLSSPRIFFCTFLEPAAPYCIYLCNSPLNFQTDLESRSFSILFNQDTDTVHQ